MDLQTDCLVVIALALLWGQALREPLLHVWRRPDRRPAPGPTQPTHALRLLTAARELEHEVTVHAARPPDAYTYAGHLYKFDRPAPNAGSDAVWEYRRR